MKHRNNQFADLYRLCKCERNSPENIKANYNKQTLKYDYITGPGHASTLLRSWLLNITQKIMKAILLLMLLLLTRKRTLSRKKTTAHLLPYPTMKNIF